MTWCGMERKNDGNAPSYYIYASSGKISYANIENADQKVHACSLIGVFDVFYSNRIAALAAMGRLSFSS